MHAPAPQWLQHKFQGQLLKPASPARGDLASGAHAPRAEAVRDCRRLVRLAVAAQPRLLTLAQARPPSVRAFSLQRVDVAFVRHMLMRVRCARVAARATGV